MRKLNYSLLRVRRSFRNLSKNLFQYLLLISVLTSNVGYPAIAIAQEVTDTTKQSVDIPVIDESEDILEEGISTSIFEEVPETTFENGVYTVNSVKLGEYIYPDNPLVKVNFIDLNEEGNLVISKVTLTEQQKVELNTTENYAWDITSTMTNGSFKYDLTLPNNLGSDVEVKYSEDGSDYINAGEYTVNDDSLTIVNLDHFTTFVVIKPNPVGNGNTSDMNDCAAVGIGYTCYETIQLAINAALTGDTINVKAGTYPERLDLKAKGLTIIGDGLSNTFIDVTGMPGYAISNFGNNTTIKDLKLVGSGLGDSGNYGFKISHVSNITLENILVESSGRTGIDLNTVDTASLKNIEIKDTVKGFGLMILDSKNITVENITTSNNLWGGVSLHAVNADTENISFTGTFNATETMPLLLEKDGPTIHDFINITLPSSFGYVAFGHDTANNYYKSYYYQSLADAKTSAGLLTVLLYDNVLIHNALETLYWVIPTLSIQDAINASDAGETIYIEEGIYHEELASWKDMEIIKSINIIGSGSGKTIIEFRNVQNGLEISGSNLEVLIEGITFTKRHENTYAASFNLRIAETTSSFTNLKLKDVEVAYAQGPNVNLGTNGTFNQIIIEDSNFHHAGSWGLFSQGNISNMNVLNSHFDYNGTVDTGHGIGFDLSSYMGHSNVNVVGGTFDNNSAKGINIVKTKDSTFKNIQANNNGIDGICLWEWVGNSTNLEFDKPSLNNNGEDGILIGVEGGNSVSGLNIKEGNIGSNHRGGLFIWNAGGVIEDIEIHNSNITNNSSYGVFTNTTPDVNATNNWWGHYSGPSGVASGLGDKVSENVTYQEWLCEPYSTNWISQNGVCKIDVPTILGWNVSSLTSNPGLTPPTLACGSSTNDNTPSHVWSPVDLEGVVYQREAKLPSGSWWTDPAIYTNTNTPFVWFGNPVNGIEGEWDTRVRAWKDSNSNGILDTNEVKSEWSDSCKITYDKTLPSAPENLFYEIDGKPLACGNYTTSYNVVAQWDDINGVNHYEYQSFNPTTGWIWPNENYGVEVATSERAGAFTVGQGTYGFRVRAVDKAGNMSEWTSLDFENSCQITYDVTDPTTPTGLHRENAEGEIFQCGDVAYRQSMTPDWDDITDDPTFSHFEYSSFNLGGVQGINEQRVDVSEFNGHGWVAPQDGTYGYAVRSVDKAGNKSAWALIDETLEGSCKITYDSIAPDAPNLISPANNLVVRGDSLTNVWTPVLGAHHYIYKSYNDAGATNERWTLETTDTSKTATNVANTTFWWRVMAVDEVGNESPWSSLWKITIDNDAPDVVIINPMDGDIVKGVVDFRGTVQDDNLLRYYYKIDGAQFVTENTVTTDTTLTDETVYTWDTTGYPNGEYELRLEARDKANNKDSGSVYVIHVIVDNEIPEVSGISDIVLDEGDLLPTSDMVIATDSYQLDKLCYSVTNTVLGTIISDECVTTTDPMNWNLNLAQVITDKVNDVLGQTVTTVDTSLIPEGTYDFSYTVFDKAGNESTLQTFMVTINNVAPDVLFAADNLAILVGGNVNFTGSFTDPSYPSIGTSDDSTWSYTFTTGDGVTVNGTSSVPGPLNFTHTYLTVGPYTAQLEVCESNIGDGEGQCTTETLTIVVTAPPQETQAPAVLGATTGPTKTPAKTKTTGTYDTGIGGPNDELAEDEVIAETTADTNTDEDVKGAQTCDNSKKISGYVYIDGNDNQKKDEDEKTFGNIKLTIYTEDGEEKTTIKEVTTDANGYWETEICSGQYKISVDKTNLPKNFDTEFGDVLSVSVPEDADSIEANVLITDNRNFWQKNWQWIILGLAAIGVLSLLVLDRKREN